MREASNIRAASSLAIGDSYVKGGVLAGTSFSARSFLSKIECLLRHSLPTLILSIGAQFYRSVSPIGPQSILVTRLDGIGDFILLSPFLRELRHLYPDAQIFLVVTPNSLPLAERCPYVNRVFTLNQSPGRGDFSTYLAYLRAVADHLAHVARFAREHLRGRVTLAIQPRWDEDLDWANLITALSGAPNRVGFTEKTTPNKSWSNFAHNLLFTKVLPPGQSLHELDRNLDIVRFLGGKPDYDNDLEVWWDASDDREAIRFLAGLGNPVIAFGIGAAKGWTRWPGYAELLSRLNQSLNFTPLILSGPREEDLAHLVAAACPSSVLLSGRPLRVVAAVLSRCALFVGNNSGPLHLASAVGIPVVELSAHPIGGDPGHENHPSRFGSRARRKTVLRPLAFKGSCRGACTADVPHCIAGILPEDVAKAIALHLAAAQPVAAGSPL